MKIRYPVFSLTANLGSRPLPAPDKPMTVPSGQEPVSLDGERLIKALAEVATNVWKAKGRVSVIAESCDATECRKLERNIESIWQALDSIGVEIVDHTGQSFDYGDALRVVTSEARVGIDREVVIETIRPTVKLQGRLLQLGEVVIATPVRSEEYEPPRLLRRLLVESHAANATDSC